MNWNGVPRNQRLLQTITNAAYPLLSFKMKTSFCKLNITVRLNYIIDLEIIRKGALKKIIRSDFLEIYLSERRYVSTLSKSSHRMESGSLTATM